MENKEIGLTDEQKKYKDAVEKRVEEVKESQCIKHEYEIKIGENTVVLGLPKRVLEQKRLLAIWNVWRFDPDNYTASEKYYTTVAPLIAVNGKRLNLDETDLELGDIDTIMQVYGDFMLLPFSQRSDTKIESHLTHL